LITFQKVLTASISELEQNDGSTTSFYTPTMVARWANLAAIEIWQKLIDNGVNMYHDIENTISVVSGTDEYSLASDVNVITNVQIRTGSAGAYQYTPVFPMENVRNHYQRVSTFPFSPALYPSSTFQWMEGGSALVAGVFTRKIKLIPSPTAACTLVYDYVRSIVQISEPPAAEAYSTTYIDLPDDLFRNLILRIQRYAQKRDRQDIKSISAEISQADDDMMMTHYNGLNRQTNRYIQRT